MMEVIVARKSLIAHDTCAFELVSADGASLPVFSAGSHVDVHVPGDILRQYSLCNAPSERHRYVIGVLREVASRGGSKGMHEKVNVGDRIIISEPRNLFPLSTGGHQSLLFAGGIGITPMLSMAEHLSASGASFELHYCCRSRNRAAFRDHIETSRFVSDVAFHVDDEGPTQKLQLPEIFARQDISTHVYVCGPAGFIDAVLSSARAHGWSDAALHCEFFTAAPLVADGDRPFEVKLAKSGRVIRVSADKTVVQALAEVGVHIPVSCEQGVCGTCLTGVIGGEPDHRDMFLTPAEQAANSLFTPCCSRSKTLMLVLDL